MELTGRRYALSQRCYLLAYFTDATQTYPLHPHFMDNRRLIPLEHSLRQTCRYLILVLALFVCDSALGAERWGALYMPDFQTVKRNGRPLDGPIRAFTQDRQGFIWITGDTSLWRWDGYELQEIHFDGIAADSPALPDITVAKADPDGMVWVATTAGLFRLDSGSLTLHRVTLGPLDSETLEHIAFDYSGGHKRLYLASDETLYEWTEGREPTLIPGHGRNRIHSLLVDVRTKLWVGTNDGLWFRNSSQNQLQPLSALKGIRISALYQAANRSIWVGTAKDGVFELEGGQPLRSLSLPAKSPIQPWVYDINEPRPGELWFATYGNGILIYQRLAKTFKQVSKERMLQTSLLDNDVWSLFRDRSGTQWVGSRTGANYLSVRQNVFRHLPAGTSGRWLSDDLVFSMAALSDGSVAVGTGNTGIDVLHPQSGVKKHLPPGTQMGAVAMPEGAIESLYALPDGSLMAGSNWNTLKISPGIERAMPLRVKGRPADAFTSDFAWFDGSLWLSGTDGLWRIDDNKAANMMLGSPDEQRINCLLADGDSLWIGTWKGLKRLDLRAGQTPLVSEVNNAMLNQKYINVMSKDRQGRLWVGTYNGGLFHTRSRQDNSWLRITEQDGLPSNKVTGILPDADGNLWIGTDRGLGRIDAVTLAIEIIRPEAGAAAAPYETAVRNADGDLLFGGNNGITVVTPGRWQKQIADAPIVFTAVRDGKGHELAINATLLSLSVPANVDSVELTFAALDFINAAHLQYRYQLLGRDKAWRPVLAESRTIVLANLPPDDYQLQIAYSLDGRQWSKQLLQLRISVLPEWHEKPALRILLGMLALAAIWLLLRWWSFRSRRRQLALEANVRDRTAELQAANQLLQKQAETIREASLTDPMTGLHNRRFFKQHIESETQMTARRYPSGSNLPIEQADLLFFLIDIDNFKRINDQLGHAAGDAVLVEMRQRLQSVFRGSDFLIRWGGEEFLAVARNTSRIKAAELAERVRIAVNGTAIYCNKPEPVTVTCSIGFAPYPFLCGDPQALRWEEILALADVALYAAKNNGRNSWVGFNGTDNAELASVLAVLRAAPETALHSAVVGVSRSS